MGTTNVLANIVIGLMNSQLETCTAVNLIGSTKTRYSFDQVTDNLAEVSQMQCLVLTSLCFKRYHWIAERSLFYISATQAINCNDVLK